MRGRIRLDVALAPSLMPSSNPPDRCVYVVIDVVRATTTLSVLFERGARRVLIAPSISAARAASSQLGASYLLAGEEGGLPPAGFDFGNSPAQIAVANVAGRDIIFATTNGTVALRACEGGRAVLAGSLRNVRAAMSAALAAVPEEGADRLPLADRAVAAGEASEASTEDASPDIVLVCSGRGSRPAFDDTLCAGALVEEAVRQSHQVGIRCELGEGAGIARAVWRQVTDAGGIEDALAASGAGRAVVQIGLGVDLSWCAARDVAAVVPRVIGRLPGATLLVMEADKTGRD